MATPWRWATAPTICHDPGAGLGVAYHAKPILAGQADARLEKTTDALLYSRLRPGPFVTG